MDLMTFAESLKRALHETPAMVPNVQPEVPVSPEKSPSIPEVSADGDMNVCSLDCELFKQILEHCGANSTMADNIVQQAKLLGKTVGTLTPEHFDDLVGAAEYETPVTSPQVNTLGSASVMSMPTVTVSTQNESVIKESLKDETSEKFEVVESEDEEKEDEK